MDAIPAVIAVGSDIDMVRKADIIGGSFHRTSSLDVLQADMEKFLKRRARNYEWIVLFEGCFYQGIFTAFTDKVRKVVKGPFTAADMKWLSDSRYHLDNGEVVLCFIDSAQCETDGLSLHLED